MNHPTALSKNGVSIAFIVDLNQLND
jgi:hypothetical protein